MADTSTDMTPAAGIVTKDGRPLKEALTSAMARARRCAFLLVAPLLVFVVATFIVPIGQMLHQSVYNDGFSTNMPHITQWLKANPCGTEQEEAA